MNEKLKEDQSVVSVKLGIIEESNALSTQYDRHNGLCPLSAFQKELEEAANEPLFSCGQNDADEESSEYCCSETASMADVDEICSLCSEEDDKLTECKDTTGVENLSPSVQRPFRFVTQLANKVESKVYSLHSEEDDKLTKRKDTTGLENLNPSADRPFRLTTPLANKVESRTSSLHLVEDDKLTERKDTTRLENLNPSTQRPFQCTIPLANKVESKICSLHSVQDDQFTERKDTTRLDNLNSSTQRPFQFATLLANKEESKICSLHLEEDDKLTEHKDTTGLENLNASTQRPFQFTTPLANKIECKTTYTPSLTKIQECNIKKPTITNEILKTPINNLLVSKSGQCIKYNISTNKKVQKGIVVSNEEKYNNKIPDKIDALIKGVEKQASLKDVHGDEESCVKQIPFNNLITPVASKANNRPLQSPNVQCNSNFNLMRTTGMQNSAQKRIGNSLTNEKQYLPVVTDGKKVININESSKKKCEKRSNWLAAEKKYLLSLNDTQHADDEKSQQNKMIENERNTQNESNNKPHQLWTGFVDNNLNQFDKIIVNNVEYISLNQLGMGGSSVVYDCYNPENKTQRAIKKVSLRGEKSCVEGYINEVKMLHKLQNCDRIIKMYSYEILKSEKLLYMVLEKGDRDLSSILKELSANTAHLPVYMLIYYWMEMLFAVKQIHENGIIHSDLKPANFLMARGGLKLIDFGIASAIQTDMTSVVKNVQIGSFNYISPEALHNNSRDSRKAEFKISFKSDVWSLGCILYQLVYRKTPFQHIGHMFAKLSAILDPNQEVNYPDADWVPPKIIETIKACLKYEVKSRPSIDELIRQYESFF